jgi:hypothetical protein
LQVCLLLIPGVKLLLQVPNLLILSGHSHF